MENRVDPTAIEMYLEGLIGMTEMIHKLYVLSEDINWVKDALSGY